MFLIFKEENKDIFEAILDGRKTIETRAMDPRYEGIAQCARVTFSCAGVSFERSVKSVTFFTSIEALLEVYKPEDINPKLHTGEEVRQMYMSFPGYEQRISENGLFAVELENI